MSVCVVSCVTFFYGIYLFYSMCAPVLICKPVSFPMSCFVDLFRKSVNKTLPLRSIPLLPEGKCKWNRGEKQTDTISISAFYSTFNPSPPPLISSHSLNIIIFQLTPPFLTQSSPFFYLITPPLPPPLYLLHSLCSFIRSRF